MSATIPTTTAPIVYPDSDGKPMAENTLQYEWIVTIKGNLDAICVGDRAAFVAGDNLIYPVEGRPDICKAPDVYVAFGRPRGHRGSYKVWEEDGVFPQVIFEVLSPGNTEREMIGKRRFYRRYGAEEYIVYDPDTNDLEITVREGRRWVLIDDPHDWTSPRLGIRFDLSGNELRIFGPGGKPFLRFEEIYQQNERTAETARQAAADNERLRAKLRAAGIDPDAP